MDRFKGKCLVRPTKLPDGRRVVILCGVFLTDVPEGEISDRDEMWTVELVATQAIKCENARNMNFSPEDFLENINGVQAPQNWQRKQG